MQGQTRTEILLARNNHVQLSATGKLLLGHLLFKRTFINR